MTTIPRAKATGHHGRVTALMSRKMRIKTRTKEVEMFENIILVVEKELRETYNFHGGFNYLDCDPEGANRISKAYKKYEELSSELNQLKKLITKMKELE